MCNSILRQSLEIISVDIDASSDDIQLEAKMKLKQSRTMKFWWYSSVILLWHYSGSETVHSCRL